MMLAGGAGAFAATLWSDPSRVQWGALAGSGLVFAAGLADDLAPPGPRGLRTHFRALVDGHVTTGVVKLLITTGAAVVLVGLMVEGDAIQRLGAVVLVAATTNTFNGLDVRPGRALKFFLAGSLICSIWIGHPGSALAVWLGIAYPAAFVALWFDLRERAMLGDSGANLIGFAFGAQLAVVLPVWAYVPAAAVAVGLNVVADTVSFSRIIQAVPPLRWFDRAGRAPDTAEGAVG